MIALLRLRKTEPNLERPFKAPLYPLFPIIALIIATVSLVAMTIYNWQLALIYVGLLAVAYVYYFVFVESKKNTTHP
jgi:ethanolamine permease